MPSKETLEQFGACWEGLEDPRRGNAALRDFHELLMIALCCVLCGGQGAVDMALFAEAKEPFLRSFLTLANGLPSYDTFSRLFRNLDPDQFRDSFQRFMAQFSEQLQGVVAIDGKVLHRSFDRASGKSPLHMVSAWGSEQRLVLAQVATDAKSNEITVVPKLLRMLALKGTIVTADAPNCQCHIAEQIVEQKGDYALALKAKRLPNGSCLSHVYPSERDWRHKTNGIAVRLIDYRLATTILDPDKAPASELAALYHQR